MKIELNARTCEVPTMTSRQEREDYRLRVLIERLQQSGHSERDIERAVREASGDMARESGRHERSGSRGGLLAWLLPI
jgi:transcriptional/translational regulatory protein YebC/TACO1